MLQVSQIMLLNNGDIMYSPTDGLDPDIKLGTALLGINATNELGIMVTNDFSKRVQWLPFTQPKLIEMIFLVAAGGTYAEKPIESDTIVPTMVKHVFKDWAAECYYYSDEAEQLNGPFFSIAQAKEMLDKYVAYLNGSPACHS